MNVHFFDCGLASRMVEFSLYDCFVMDLYGF
jgi:hypothetical protein